MKHAPVSPARRRAVNVSLDADTVAAAKDLGIPISQICQAALAAEVTRERMLRWQNEHRDAIEAHNAWVDKHGLPLADLPIL
jgi:antitoxin CcdA